MFWYDLIKTQDSREIDFFFSALLDIYLYKIWHGYVFVANSDYISLILFFDLPKKLVLEKSYKLAFPRLKLVALSTLNSHHPQYSCSFVNADYWSGFVSGPWLRSFLFVSWNPWILIPQFQERDGWSDYILYLDVCFRYFRLFVSLMYQDSPSKRQDNDQINGIIKCMIRWDPVH